MVIRALQRCLAGKRPLLSRTASMLVSGRQMATKTIPVPYMADSITQGTLGTWEKKVGDMIKPDELVANIETDKVTIPVNCPEGGKLVELCAKEGDTVEVGSDLFKIDTDAKGQSKADNLPDASKDSKPAAEAAMKNDRGEKVPARDGPKAAEAPATGMKSSTDGETRAVGPAASAAGAPHGRPESREKMTRLRMRIAERMKEAQNTAASLTTINEADMSEIMSIRNKHKEAFLKEHNVKLGYMSMFIKACTIALQEIPVVNARIDGNEIVFPEYVDISVAVATPKGLVTPVIKDCHKKSFAELEKELSDYSVKARENKIGIEELTGGTFTISNGGVFGSLLGTPILNMPQLAILGMHAIKERPVVVGGEIKVRPMMYLALTYDHRVIDGREAATFLVRVKELLEDPHLFLLDL